MSEKKLRRLPLAAAALVACVSAQAEYQSPDGNFRMSGFGTLGAVHSSTNDVKFNYPGQGGGAGTAWNTSPDSKLAVQGTYKIIPSVSATMQVMSKYDANGSYEPKVDWAFAKWQALPSLTLRGGRMGAPFFMISDFRDVGYANTPIRPPLDVYGQVPVSQFEGADATYQLPLGSTTLNATVFAGDAASDFSSARRKSGEPTSPGVVLPLAPSEFSLSGLMGLNLQAEMDNGLTFRFGYSQAKMSLSSPSTDLLLANTASGPASALRPAVNAIVIDAEKIAFTGFGVAYDQDDWVASAEFTRRHSESFIADTTGWYVNVGHRFGKFTPYVGLSRLSVDDPNKANSLAAAINAVSGTGAISRGIQGLLNVQKLDQRTTTLGVRWDATSSVAVKAQWDHVTKPADSYGLFYTDDPGTAQARSFLNSTRRVNIISLAVDFVF